MNRLRLSLAAAALFSGSLFACSAATENTSSSDSYATSDESPFAASNGSSGGAFATGAADAGASDASPSAVLISPDAGEWSGADLAGQASLAYATAKQNTPSAAGSVLAWQVDRTTVQTATDATSDSFSQPTLEVLLPEGTSFAVVQPTFLLNTKDGPTIRMKTTTGTLDPGVYACSAFAGTASVAIGGEAYTSDPADCTITITSRNLEEVAPEIAPFATPSTFITGNVTATVKNAAGATHSLRAGFFLVQAQL